MSEGGWKPFKPHEHDDKLLWTCTPGDAQPRLVWIYDDGHWRYEDGAPYGTYGRTPTLCHEVLPPTLPGEQPERTFREHRGTLADSLETRTPVKGRTGLIALLRERLGVFRFTFEDADLTVRPYAKEERTGEDLHIVQIRGYGVAGFVDGPLP